MIRFYCSLLLLLLLGACTDKKWVPIQIDGITAEVELAYTPEQRMQGLMERDHLAADRGMLLIFPQQRILQMWMLNTRIPLDVAFFDAEGLLVNRLSMEPDGGRKIHASSAPAVYALEMNLGWFDRQGIADGARLSLPVQVQAY